jgi:hypothetical protein
MVKIVHEHNGKRVEGESQPHGTGMFLLTNKKGSFLSLSSPSISQYNGLIVYDSENECLFKTVDMLAHRGIPTTVVNRVSHVERQYKDETSERYWLSSQAMHYHFTGNGEIIVDMDMRRLNDFDTRGRTYLASINGDEVTIHYRKFTDDTQQHLAYERFLVIKGAGKFDAQGTWVEKQVPYDRRRGEKENLWVYRAGMIPVVGGANLVVTSSNTLEMALEKARSVFEREDEILESNEAYVKKAYNLERLEENLALASLDSMVTKLKNATYTGIWAGLPWFTQFWSRDETDFAWRTGETGTVWPCKRDYHTLLRTARRTSFARPLPDGWGALCRRIGMVGKTNPRLVTHTRRGEAPRRVFHQIGNWATFVNASAKRSSNCLMNTLMLV